MSDSIKIQGHVDAQHQLSLEVPGSIPPGPVTVWIAPSTAEGDPVGEAWEQGIAREWREELADSRQDIYTLEDGDALDTSE